eukprot:96337-Pelagomonas_calceolata.AAC.1
MYMCASHGPLDAESITRAFLPGKCCLMGSSQMKAQRGPRTDKYGWPVPYILQFYISCIYLAKKWSYAACLHGIGRPY